MDRPGRTGLRNRPESLLARRHPVGAVERFLRNGLGSISCVLLLRRHVHAVRAVRRCTATPINSPRYMSDISVTTCVRSVSGVLPGWSRAPCRYLHRRLRTAEKTAGAVLLFHGGTPCGRLSPSVPPRSFAFLSRSYPTGSRAGRMRKRGGGPCDPVAARGWRRPRGRPPATLRRRSASWSPGERMPASRARARVRRFSGVGAPGVRAGQKALGVVGPEECANCEEVGQEVTKQLFVRFNPF